MCDARFNPQPRLGKVPEVSRMANWSDKTTRRLIDGGKLPGVCRIGARLIRVDLDILEQWIAQGCPPISRFAHQVVTPKGGQR